MLLRLIEDMNQALDNDCFFSALALALTFPDICGKAKYPNAKTRQRYINWYDEYVGCTEKCPGYEMMPYLSGEVVYSLRCSLLHQGNPNIEKEKITEENCKIDHFTLLTEKKKDFNIYADSASISDGGLGSGDGGKTTRSYEVNVRRLCLILAACAKGYYRDYPEQFDFFDFSVVDLDERYADLQEYTASQIWRK